LFFSDTVEKEEVKSDVSRDEVIRILQAIASTGKFW